MAYPSRIATIFQYYVKREKCKVNDVIFPPGCEARTINLDKNMKIGTFTGGTSVRSKNIFTAISRHPTGKHEVTRAISVIVLNQRGSGDPYSRTCFQKIVNLKVTQVLTGCTIYGLPLQKLYYFHFFSKYRNKLCFRNSNAPETVIFLKKLPSYLALTLADDRHVGISRRISMKYIFIPNMSM